MYSLIRSILPQSFLLIAALLCAGLAGGCSTPMAHVEITPSNGHDSVIQNFPHAYMSVSEDGDEDIVLVSEGLLASQTRNHVLLPAEINPLKQVVHIHILWRPLPGTRADQPTSTNAVIDWYVISNMAEAADDKLIYRGAGFIAVYPTKKGAHLVIRNATMSLSQKTGDLVDPFGPANLSGAFDVVRNDGMTRDVISSATNPPVASPLPATTESSGHLSSGQSGGPEVPTPVLPHLQ